MPASAQTNQHQGAPRPQSAARPASSGAKRGGAAQRPKAGGGADPGHLHVVKPGETLWSIAESHMGSGTEWPRLFAANRTKIKNKNALRVGTVLSIPERGGGGGGGGEAPAAPGPDAAPRPPGGGGGGGQAPQISGDRLFAAREFYNSHPGLYPPHVVRRIQSAVGADSDGVIGLQTIRAVAGWQQGHRLKADGIAGKATCTAMFGRDIRFDPKPQHPPRPGGGMSQAQVRDVINWYARHRSQYPPSVIQRIEGKVGQPGNGQMDGATVQAIVEWQRAHGLTADGYAGPATLTAMFGHDIRMGEQAPPRPGGPQGPAQPDGNMDRPHGVTALRRTFGEPGKHIVGVAMRAGAGGQMVTVRCHQKIAGKLAAVFEDIHREGMSQHIKSYGGCYVYRKKRGSGSQWSTHAWGIAVDINAEWNPMTSRRNMRVSSDQRILVPFFERHGFYWGGNFGDPMHFQYCTGY